MKAIIYEELKVGDSVITRDGRKGRVICTDLNMEYPIAFRFPAQKGVPDGAEGVQFSLASGLQYKDEEHPMDIFLPPKTEYVNVYKDKSKLGGYVCGLPCNTKEDADDEAHDTNHYRVCVKTIEVEV